MHVVVRMVKDLPRGERRALTMQWDSELEVRKVFGRAAKAGSRKLAFAARASRPEDSGGTKGWARSLRGQGSAPREVFMQGRTVVVEVEVEPWAC